MLKELLRYEGKSTANTGSPREILKAAYSVYDFIDEDIWLDMLRSGNDMTHIYDGEAAKRLVGYNMILLVLDTIGEKTGCSKPVFVAPLAHPVQNGDQ